MPSRREADMFACRAGAWEAGASGAAFNRVLACREGRTWHEFMDLKGRTLYICIGFTGGRGGTREAAASDFQVPPRRHPPGTRDTAAF